MYCVNPAACGLPSAAFSCPLVGARHPGLRRRRPSRHARAKKIIFYRTGVPCYNHQLHSKLSTPRSHRHWFCIVAILRSRSVTQAGPWILATQPTRNALSRRDLGFRSSQCMLQRLHSRLLPLRTCILHTLTLSLDRQGPALLSLADDNTRKCSGVVENLQILAGQLKERVDYENFLEQVNLAEQLTSSDFGVSTGLISQGYWESSKWYFVNVERGNIADKIQPRNINVSFTNNNNVPIDVIIFTFYSDQLTIDVETGIVTKYFFFIILL